MTRTAEGGFTLLETLIAAALGTLVLGGALLAGAQLSRTAAAADDRMRGIDAVARLDERLHSDASSAWAVFVTPGNASEVDFYSQDGAHRPFFWRYSYDATMRAVARGGEIFAPVSGFLAAGVQASQIGVLDPLFANARVPDVAYAFSPGTPAGNALVHVRIDAPGIVRDEFLSSATAPTTFTVVIEYTPSPPPIATPTPTPIPQRSPAA